MRRHRGGRSGGDSPAGPRWHFRRYHGEHWPDSAFCRYRATFLLIVVLFVLAAVLGSGLPGLLAAWIAFGPMAELMIGIAFGLVGLGGGLALGLTVGMIWTPWPTFLLTDAWLVARGRRLPRDLIAFLADAHEKRGVLRQVGAVYQFRHVELQRCLANQRGVGQISAPYPIR
jgi:hypothetical protein